MEGLRSCQDASRGDSSTIRVMIEAAHAPLRDSRQCPQSRSLAAPCAHPRCGARPRRSVSSVITHDAITGQTGAHYTTGLGLFRGWWIREQRSPPRRVNAIAQATERKSLPGGAGRTSTDNAAARSHGQLTEQWSIPVQPRCRAKGVFPTITLVARRVRLCGHAPRHGAAQACSRCVMRARSV